jgi:hypothetical protein
MQRRRKNENKEIRQRETREKDDQRETKTEAEGKKEALPNQCTNRPQLRLRLQA